MNGVFVVVAEQGWRLEVMNPAICYPPTDGRLLWAGFCSAPLQPSRPPARDTGWELKKASSLFLIISSQPAKAKAFLSQYLNTS